MERWNDHRDRNQEGRDVSYNGAASEYAIIRRRDGDDYPGFTTTRSNHARGQS